MRPPEAPTTTDVAGTDLMTIGELSQRTGVSVKVLRRYEGLGLIYTAGRDPANYRLFDQSALWCVGVVDGVHVASRRPGLRRCEVLAFSNWVLRREDEVGCVLFLPVDHLERRTSGQSSFGIEQRWGLG